MASVFPKPKLTGEIMLGGTNAGLWRQIEFLLGYSRKKGTYTIDKEVMALIGFRGWQGEQENSTFDSGSQGRAKAQRNCNEYSGL